MFRMHTDTPSTTSLVSGSVADMAALLDIANIPEHNHDRWQSNVNDLANAYGSMRKDSFGGLSSITEAKEIFERQGWQDGADRARAEIPSLNLGDFAPEAVAIKRRRTFADAGDTLRVEAALSGNWDQAYETRTKKATRQPVTLSVGCAFGGPGEITHDEMFWNGLQMAALCDLLEGAGWRIELRALKANNFGSTGKVHAQDWTVKQSDQPLRLDTTLALFGHAGVYRSHGWAALSASSYKNPGNGGHVQRGTVLVETFRRLAAASIIPPLSLIIPQAYSRDEAVRNLTAALKTLKDPGAA